MRDRKRRLFENWAVGLLRSSPAIVGNLGGPPDARSFAAISGGARPSWAGERHPQHWQRH